MAAIAAMAAPTVSPAVIVLLLWEPPWRVIVAGNIVPKKRVYTAVQLAHDVGQDFHLELYGSGGQPGYGNPEYPANVSDLIEELGMAARMRSKAFELPTPWRMRGRWTPAFCASFNRARISGLIAPTLSFDAGTSATPFVCTWTWRM